MNYDDSSKDHAATAICAAIGGTLTDVEADRGPDIKDAVRQFCTPNRTSRGGFEEQLVESSERVWLSNGVAGYIWGEGPRTLLVHGWCGRGTQLGAFIEPLIQIGHSVMAIDCWGHGDSPGVESHGVKFSECIVLADREFGPFDSAVGHSVGGAAIGIALNRGVKLNRAVMLAPPAISEVVREFGIRNGFSEENIEDFTNELAKQSGFKMSQVDLIQLAPKLDTPILIFHDPADTTVSIKGSELFCARNSVSTLIKVAGLNHLRIMRSKEVVTKTVKFLRGVD